MVLHQSKIGLVIPLQRIMKEGYPKKDASPDNVYSDSTSVLGLVTLNVCCNLGEVWKNACSFSICALVKLSTNFLNSLGVVVDSSNTSSP